MHIEWESAELAMLLKRQVADGARGSRGSSPSESELAGTTKFLSSASAWRRLCRRGSKRPKCDERYLADHSPAIAFATAILPSQQPAKPAADQRGDKSVAVLIIAYHSHRLILPKETMRGSEMFSAHGHLLAARRLDVPDPVGIGAEAVRHDDLGTIASILDDLQYSLPPQAGAPPNVR